MPRQSERRPRGRPRNPNTHPILLAFFAAQNAKRRQQHYWEDYYKRSKK